MRSLSILAFSALLGVLVAVGSAQPLSGQERFIGTWENVDPEHGLPRIVISEQAGDLQIRAWGNCVPEDCDWGAVPLYLIGTSIGDETFDRAFATWEDEYDIRHFILVLDGDQLVVETVTIWLDDSGRSHYRRLNLMRHTSSDP